MPNAEIDPDTPLSAFVVPIEALETVSGLQFFPATLTAARRHHLDEAACGWQQAGRAALRARCLPRSPPGQLGNTYQLFQHLPNALQSWK